MGNALTNELVIVSTPSFKVYCFVNSIKLSIKLYVFIKCESICYNML